MPTPPDKWQEQLERHFTQIAETRSVSEFPIFALEHGLAENDLQEIGGYLRQRVARGFPLDPYWLLWVIYATELGYLYDGHDYWPPFEEQTPHWRENGDQHQLKSCFRRFQKTFGGVVPSGPWAVHFNRIAWPIKHAVLPKLLQVQFARALFDVSKEVARTPNLDAASAGRLLAKHSFYQSTRFQEFLQQEELAGRIMLALLDKKPSGAVEDPIYQPTLQRIIADVLKVQSAGEYLKEARRIVSDRFHGVDRGPVNPTTIVGGGYGGERQADQPLSIQPTLSLRRATISSWSVVLEIPNFSGVAKLSADLAQFLKGTRCKVAGTGPTLFPPSWLLYGPQVRTLKSWPAPNEPPIRFENANPTLDNLLGRECRFSPGPTWLFRIGSDGLARENSGHLVRAGQKYIIASRDQLSSDLLAGAATDIQCKGIHGLAIEIPEYVSPEITAELRKFGIEVARNVRVWPAGLCIRNWDGEGHGDWLSTEIPCFGISHDYAVDEYFIKLNNAPEIRIEGARAKEVIFVRLPSLAPGQHTFSVRARRVGVATSGPALKDLQGRVELKVRDPSHWKPGAATHSGLTVATDPHDPSLDGFWEGTVGVSVNGPEGHSVTCAISLVGKSGDTILSEEIGKFDLPIKPSQWLNKFRNFTKLDSRYWKFLEASSGQFSIRGQELGQFNLRLERELRPVRWVHRVSGPSTEVRLVDDSDSGGALTTEHLSFERPIHIHTLDASQAHAGMTVTAPGGLYFAKLGDHRDTLVVDSSRSAHGLSDLMVPLTLDELGTQPADLVRLLAFAQLWNEARLAGTLASSRRSNVVNCLLKKLNDSLCGTRWLAAEEAYRADPASTGRLEHLKSLMGGHRSLPAVLVSRAERTEQPVDQATDWFCEVSERYGTCKDLKLAEFALKLAGNPLGIVAEYAADTESLLKQVSMLPDLVRSARLLSVLMGVRRGQLATVAA